MLKTSIEKAYKDWSEPIQKNYLQRKMEIAKWLKASSQTVDILPKRQPTPTQKFNFEESRVSSKKKVKEFTVSEECAPNSKKLESKEKKSKTKLIKTTVDGNELQKSGPTDDVNSQNHKQQECGEIGRIKTLLSSKPNMQPLQMLQDLLKRQESRRPDDRLSQRET